MLPTDDVDFMLTLHGHGWSTARFIVGREAVELRITHVFNDPYATLMQALTTLLLGRAEAEVLWYDEPGGARLNLELSKSQPDRVSVEICSFCEAVAEPPSNPGSYTRLSVFEISLHHLLTLAYIQLRKDFLLLQEKSYAKTRQQYFPFQEFRAFEQLLKNRLYPAAT